jgi:UDP-N-acetylglucosamine--N-acetylmuramyl-(pentapeptide) pyrophosphoryl-undecaprenol N-acetylglucosamine transferase
VYPAISVLQATLDEEEAGNGSDILWVGGAGGMESELVDRAGIPFVSIPAAGVHGVGLRALPGNLLRLWRGFWQARRLLRQYRPDVLFFTGGYVAVPMALAGRNLPSLIFVPDIEPGLALKFLTRIASKVAVVAQEARTYFPSGSDITVTGYPVRIDLEKWDLDAARNALGLSADLPTLLVFGGSKGARSINNALLAILPELLTEMQVVHISGNLDWPQVETVHEHLTKTLPKNLAERYHPFPYLHKRMGAALQTADLAVARAGASTLGEFPHFALPAVLVPYPHAWRYQQVNAEYLERHDAAMILNDTDLGEHLLPLIETLIKDDDKRRRMREAMQSLAQPAAAKKISKLLHQLAHDANRERN